MTASVFENIKKRVTYLSEVQKHVIEVLNDFRIDASNSDSQITINDDDIKTVMGPIIEIKETGANKKSSIYAEIYTTGEVEILRECSVNNQSGETTEEHGSLDFSKEPESTAADLLLMLAKDHLGFVGSKLEAYLNGQIFEQPGITNDYNFDP